MADHRKPTQDDINAAARGLHMLTAPKEDLQETVSTLRLKQKRTFADDAILAAAEQMLAAKTRVGLFRKNPSKGRYYLASVKGGKFTVARIMADNGIPFAFVREQRGGYTVGKVAKRFAVPLNNLRYASPALQIVFAEPPATEVHARDILPNPSQARKLQAQHYGRYYTCPECEANFRESALDSGKLPTHTFLRKQCPGSGQSVELQPRRNPSDIRIVYNKLLGGWYVVRGPHQTPLNGRFNSKAEAQEWLRSGSVRRNPRGNSPCHPATMNSS